MCARKRSIVLLSGGLDSAINLAFCADQDQPVLALTVDYGQRAASAEIRAARSLAGYYGVEHRVLELKWLGALGGSALTETARELPQPDPGKLDDALDAAATARAVWVPNRNGVLINVASALAERAGAEQIVVGFNREEAATFSDNSREFLERASAALALSTANHVVARCYTVDWDKREMVRRVSGLARPFPFDRIWSCYEGGERPCGKCESCRRLERALLVKEER